MDTKPIDSKIVSDALSRQPNSAGQFAGFIAVGVASASLSIVTRFIANQFLPFEAAVVVAHVIGMLFSFALNRRLIFPATARPVWNELSKFTLVNLLSLAIATGVSSWLYRLVLPALGVTAFPGLIAHVLGLAACALPSFFGHKFFSFRQGRGRGPNSGRSIRPTT